MASQEMGSLPTQPIDTTTTSSTSLNPQLLFQHHNLLPFGCSAPNRRGSGDPGPKTLHLGSFMDEKLFPANHRDRYLSPELRGVPGGGSGGPTFHRRNWTMPRSGSTPSSGNEEEEEDAAADDDDGDNDEGDRDGVIGNKVGIENSKDNASFGSSSRQLVMKDVSFLQPNTDANRLSSSENGQQGRVGHYQKMVTIAEHDGDMYYSQLLQSTEGSCQGHKDIAGDNGCGFSGRKESSVSSDLGESLRSIFSDPITGALMDDAMILPCGHSFGRGGIEQIIKMKSCYTCSNPVSEDSVVPNLSLRVAIQAFLREQDVMMFRFSKRRRERFEQDKGYYGDSSFPDTPRGRGVQFPFAVTDRVIIKGNKRTPQRFVGREAIVTTQCLNGWYVVKTLDNAESVKLQYRSLEKVADSSSSKPMPDKMRPNWM